MPRPLRHRAAVAVGVALATLSVAPAARAATITYEGETLVYTAAAGERNAFIVGPSGIYAQAVRIGDAVAIDHPADSCVTGDGGWLHCAAPGAVRVDLGDLDDTSSFVSSEALPNPITVLGGAGQDTMRGLDHGSEATLDGGPGDDTLEGKGADETLVGGDGNDRLTGNGGGDRLFGGAGDDVLDGDRYEPMAPDLLDGGPGSDKLEGWARPGADHNPPVVMTLDGTANDGRPGEGDDVRDVERVQVHVSGTFSTSDAADVIDVWANIDQGASTIATHGGNDRITGGNMAETIDAGAGDDHVEAGFGDDTITGGPGRDTIYADKVGGNCGLFESCDVPVGNDQIDARDGEVDTIDCGVGTDTARVDAIDVVAANCEHVERAATPSPGTPGTPDGPAASKPRLAVVSTKASYVVRKGLRIRVTGARQGRATIVARVGRRTLGKTRVRIGAGGSVRATIRVSRSTRRLVRRGARIVVSGAGAKLTVKVR